MPKRIVWQHAFRTTILWSIFHIPWSLFLLNCDLESDQSFDTVFIAVPTSRRMISTFQFTWLLRNSTSEDLLSLWRGTLLQSNSRLCPIKARKAETPYLLYKLSDYTICWLWVMPCTTLLDWPYDGTMYSPTKFNLFMQFIKSHLFILSIRLEYSRLWENNSINFLFIV